MTSDAGRHQPIASVSTGMRVVDSIGEDIGEVEVVRMGDPEAITAEGQRTDDSFNIFDTVAEAFAGSGKEVPQEMAERLQRLGYIQVDGKGLLDIDRYVASDQIAEVTGDTVRLKVRRDQLARQT